MPQRMRVDAFLPEGRYGRSGGDQMLAKQVVHPEAGVLVAAIIDNSAVVALSGYGRSSTSRCNNLAVCGQIGQTRTLFPLPSSYLARPLHAQVA